MLGAMQRHVSALAWPRYAPPRFIASSSGARVITPVERIGLPTIWQLKKRTQGKELWTNHYARNLLDSHS